jgi:hypothetical protein
MCRHVIEPFAGAAGYSVYWEPKEVTLIEQNPAVYGVWDYLRRVSPSEVMRLPSNISHVDELSPRVCQEAKWLIGFWFDVRGQTKPLESRSTVARTPIHAARSWSDTVKRRIASQVDRIRHWEIIHGNYQDAPDVKAHWHIDPPYNNAAGDLYTLHKIDHQALAQWCLSRCGWRQVCENDGAAWLGFKPFSILQTSRGKGYSVEVVHESSNWPPRRIRSNPDRRRRGRGASVVRRRSRKGIKSTRRTRHAS